MTSQNDFARRPGPGTEDGKRVSEKSDHAGWRRHW
jgi:hypothetical protein